ncbi:MAG: hypothetical protein E7045_10730 [Lentisphaerae bacterium]|nr:hypothetical protein [Lentisphaerota bacterium]
MGAAWQKKLCLSTGTMNLRKEIPQTEPALIRIHTVRRPCLLRRSSGKLEIQVESEDIPEQPVTPLKTAILQAHQGMAQLTSGKASTMREIANKLKMDRSYLARTLQLANLAPDIVKLIWENRQQETLTLDKLRGGIPESWEEQQKLFLS